MITVPIHIGSLFVGIVIGLVIAFMIYLLIA